MFKPATPELVRRYYPDYHPEEFGWSHHTYPFEVHLIDKTFWPLVDRCLRPGDVAVDLGCGPGTIVSQLDARGARAIGVDLKDSGFGRRPDLTLIKADARDLPLESESVDLVTSRWMFEHLEDPSTVVREIRRVLKPGGHALIVAPNVLHPGMMLSKILPTGVKQWLLRLNGIEENWVLPTYYRANTRHALHRSFDSAGFREVEFAYSADSAYWLFSGTLFRVAMAAGRVTELLGLQRFRMQLVGLYQKLPEREPVSRIPEESTPATPTRS